VAQSAVVHRDPATSAVRALETEVATRSLDSGWPDAAKLAPGVPVSFQFRWNNRRFVASIRTEADGKVRLAVTVHLAGPDSTGPGTSSMIVGIATDEQASRAELTLINGTNVLVRETYTLQAASNLSVDDLVTRLTSAVLHAAPYLDLLSEVEGRA
jgi:hypothetical protein